MKNRTFYIKPTYSDMLPYWLDVIAEQEKFNTEHVKEVRDFLEKMALKADELTNKNREINL